ncbi:MAG: ABC transporter permease [Pyrinomonadaceae bacterium]
MSLTDGQSGGVIEPTGLPQTSFTADAAARRHELPDTPLVVGRPGAAWAPLDLGEMWAYRELLYFLTWRDIKVRYKQTAFGAAWVIFQPLFTMLVFTFFFGKLVGAPEGIPYPLFAYTGLLPWTFFANAVSNGSNGLANNSDLITKVYFPRMIIPASAVTAGLLDLAIASVVLVVMTLYYDVAATGGMLLLPLFVVLTALLALALGLLVSALGVKYRDVRHALPFLLYLWMFSSPIIYPSSVVAEEWRWALNLNPMKGIIEGFRAALLGREFDWPAVAVAAVVVAVLLVVAAYAFRRAERSFADLI